jgi:hypothetical protein
MTKKTIGIGIPKKSLLPTPLNGKKRKNSRPGNSTREIFAGLSTEPFIRKSPIGLV